MTGSDLPTRIFELTLQPASRLIVGAIAAACLATGIPLIRIDSPTMGFWRHLAASNIKDFLAASPRDIAYPVAALTGLHLLSVRHHAPTMPDFGERADDADRLYDPSEPCAAKKRIVDRRHIDFIIAEQGKPDAQSVAQCGWEVVLSSSRFIVWRTSRPKQAAYRFHPTRMKT